MVKHLICRLRGHKPLLVPNGSKLSWLFGKYRPCMRRTYWVKEPP